MIFTALIIGFSFILGGFIIGSSPRIMAGCGNLTDEELRSNKIKRFVRIKKISLFGSGIMILLSGMATEITGIVKIFELSVVIFSGILVLLTIYSSYKLSGNKISFFKLSRRNVYILSFVILFPVLLIFCFTRDTKIEINHSYIEIGGMYGDKIPFDKIKAVNLVESLPAIQVRTNGFAFRNTLIGYFRMKNLGNVKLFVHSGAPYIRIETNSRFYFVNFKEKDRTIDYYRKIIQGKAK